GRLQRSRRDHRRDGSRRGLLHGLRGFGGLLGDGGRRGASCKPQGDGESREQLSHLKSFFHWRMAAKVATSSSGAPPSWADAACLTAGVRVRRNGLTCLSSPTVEGSVGSPRSRCCTQCSK